MSAQLEDHYRTIARYMRDGVVVPFLGAGVNMCGRTETETTADRPPSGDELAAHLARTCSYPESDDRNLVRVSQYMAVKEDEASLYRELRKVFDRDYPPTPLHRFLAGLPALMRAQPQPVYQMIVSTNYDDALERAFADAGEEIDVVTYIAGGKDRGKLLHQRPDGEIVTVRTPNRYEGLSLEVRPVVVKIHGAVDRSDVERDSYVITEDHYIDYLTRTEVKKLIPVNLSKVLHQSHFLFLGYSLRDWNLRVILHRIWGDQHLEHRSFAVQLDPDPIEVKSWAQRNVDILELRLADYVAGLDAALRASAPATP
jgi:hypothetical protein